MNLADKLHAIIDLLDFPAEEKENVLNDLLLAIGMEVSSELTEVQQEKLKEAIKTGTGLPEALTDIRQTEDIENKYTEAVQRVLEDWLVAVLPSLDETKQQEVLEKLKNI